MVKAVQGAVDIALIAGRVGALAAEKLHAPLMHCCRVPDLKHGLLRQIAEAGSLGPILGTQRYIAIPVDGELISQIMANASLIDLGLIARVNRPGAIGQLQAEVIGIGMPAVAQDEIIAARRLEHGGEFEFLMRTVIHADDEIGEASRLQFLDLLDTQETPFVTSSRDSIDG